MLRKSKKTMLTLIVWPPRPIGTPLKGNGARDIVQIGRRGSGGGGKRERRAAPTMSAVLGLLSWFCRPFWAEFLPDRRIRVARTIYGAHSPLHCVGRALGRCSSGLGVCSMSAEAGSAPIGTFLSPVAVRAS